jgi:hypothetical protein
MLLLMLQQICLPIIKETMSKDLVTTISSETNYLCLDSEKLCIEATS